MGNALYKTTTIGTLGELLVQFKLLQFGVQAAPPIKDSGNDLVAIKGRVVKLIQVKTSENTTPSIRDLPEIYDLVFLVRLVKDNMGSYLVDSSPITIVNSSREKLGVLSQDLVNELWSPDTQ